MADRSRGGFAAPESECAEPRRTERLLASPMRLLRGHAADAIAQLEGTLLSRAAGSCGLWTVLYDWLVLVHGLMIQAALAFGDAIDLNGTVAGLVQLSVVLVLQWALAVYILFIGPCVDRHDDTVTMSQYALEGVATAVMLAHAVDQRVGLSFVDGTNTSMSINREMLEHQRHDKDWSVAVNMLVALMLAMLLPIALTVYDLAVGVFRSLAVCCHRFKAWRRGEACDEKATVGGLVDGLYSLLKWVLGAILDACNVELGNYAMDLGLTAVDTAKTVRVQSVDVVVEDTPSMRAEREQIISEA